MGAEQEIRMGMKQGGEETKAFTLYRGELSLGAFKALTQPAEPWPGHF